MVNDPSAVQPLPVAFLNTWSIFLRVSCSALAMADVISSNPREAFGLILPF